MEDRIISLELSMLETEHFWAGMFLREYFWILRSFSWHSLGICLSSFDFSPFGEIFTELHEQFL